MRITGFGICVATSIASAFVSTVFMPGSLLADPLKDLKIEAFASEDVSASYSSDHIAAVDDLGLVGETEVGVKASSKLSKALELSASASGAWQLSEDADARQIKLKNKAKFKLWGGWDASLSYEPTWVVAVHDGEKSFRKDKVKIGFGYKEEWTEAPFCMKEKGKACSKLLMSFGYSETYKPRGKVSRVPYFNLVWTKPFGLTPLPLWDLVFEFSDQTDELALQLENELIEDFELSEKLALVRGFKSDPANKDEDITLEFYAKHSEAYSNADIEEPEDWDRWSVGVKLSYETSLLGGE
jgi:hypothetical protein